MTRCFGLLTLVLVIFAPSITKAQPGAEWQQHVRYEMDVSLLADRHLMNGRQEATYLNNSPDTLDRVFYHLYFNAFQPHSMMAERNRQLPDPDARIVPRIFELEPDEIGYHRIQYVRQNGTPVPYTVFDTVMEVVLNEPIPPGGSAVFEMAFNSQVPLQTRRSGRDNLEGIDYSMTQWYPKIAAYDERGWHADPYVGREFYAPFGTFDVRITLPSQYVIGSTGVLQNPEDVGHGYADAVIDPAGDSLTWHFQAENVHDFAWSADPDYVHDVFETDLGTTIHLLYQPDVADTWQRLHDWMPEIMSFFGRHYGEYLYPQMTIAQGGDGGMEYPMITLVTGRRSPTSLLGVTAHEVAHMWFYGMMGSNEADYAWMDEGFTSYASSEVTAHIQGGEASHVGAFLNVLQARHYGLFEALNTPSDFFDTNFAYSVASYSGGEMLLDMLGYIISDSLRDRFLHAFHDRYAFRHADPYDVERVAEDVSGLRLDWYFEQFGDTDWTLDYELDALESRQRGDQWMTSVTLEREGRAVMPVDVRLTLADGSERWVNVPLSLMEGHKPVPADWVVTEPWAWTSPEYTFDVVSTSRVVAAEIDPLLQTPESNRLDNHAKLPLDVSFLEPPGRSWDRYQIGWRPLVQYAHNWGVGGGIQLRGAYLFDRYRTKGMIKLWPEVLLSGGDDPGIDVDNFFSDGLGQSSALDGLDYDISFSNTFAAGPVVTWTLRSRKHLGILQNDAEVSLLPDPVDLLRPRTRRLTLGVRHQHRTSDRSFYNIVSEGFIPQAMLSAHGTLTRLGAHHRLELFGEAGGSLRSLGPPRTANRVWVDAAGGRSVGPFAGTVRLFIGLGDRELARHKQFRLGGASFERRWASAAYRNIGGAFEDPLEDLHWVALDLPGPVAYLRHESKLTDGVLAAFARSNVVAASVRLLTPYAGQNGLLRPLRFEAFAGTGQTWNGHWIDDFYADNLLADAGLGVRYDLSRLRGFNRWIGQSDVLTGLTLTARFPVWASHPDRTDGDEPLAFRWLVGIQLDDLPWQ